MKNLASTSDILRLVTSAAARIEVNASFVDYELAGAVVSDRVTPGRPPNAVITAATTTTIVPAPAAGVVRNVKDLTIRNNHATASCGVTVEHFDGTNAAELIQVTLLPGENINLNESGQWLRLDAAGVPYPPIGEGRYDGFLVPFLKAGTAGDGVGFWYCSAKDPGYPGAWSPGTPGVNGRVTDGTNAADFGCIPIKNPATGKNYLTESKIAGTVAHTHLFFDVLWVNSGLSPTTLTEQAIATPVFPARDVNGGTDGEGCLIAALVTSAMGNGSNKADTTVRYTNSKGVANRVATLINQAGACFPATPVVGTLVFFLLQAGDTGVKSIEGFTNVTTQTSGTLSLMVVRWVEVVANPIVNVSGISKPDGKGIRLYNSTCLLHGYVIGTTTATTMQGSLTIEEKD